MCYFSSKGKQVMTFSSLPPAQRGKHVGFPGARCGRRVRKGSGVATQGEHGASPAQQGFCPPQREAAYQQGCSKARERDFTFHSTSLFHITSTESKPETITSMHTHPSPAIQRNNSDKANRNVPAKLPEHQIHILTMLCSPYACW